MSDEFYIGEKRYISAKRASKLTGYASDYIGQLARSGKVDAQIVGRSWFVCEDSLLGYKRNVIDHEISGNSGRFKKQQSAKKAAAKSEPQNATADSRKKHAKIPQRLKVVPVVAYGQKLYRRMPRVSAMPAVRIPLRIVEAPIKAIAEPVVRELAPVAVTSPYFKPELIRAAGNLFMSGAVALGLLLVIFGSANFYRSLETGTNGIAGTASAILRNAGSVVENTPAYFNAGLAAVGTAVSDDGAESAFSRFARTAVAKFNRSAVAFYHGVNSLIGSDPFIDMRPVHVAKNVEDRKEDASAGIVVVPSTGDKKTDEEIERHIRDSFSDEVVIEQDDDGTGVIKPVFKSGKEDEYLYVLVPIGDGG